jgi:hypothetical protein
MRLGNWNALVLQRAPQPLLEEDAMSIGRFRFVGPALIAVMFSGPVLAAGALADKAKEPVAILTEKAPRKLATAAKAPAPDEQARYEAREKSAQDLEKFEGGASIYIGGSVLGLALLLGILLILL